MTVRVNGATEVAPLTDNSAPDGVEANVSGTVCGCEHHAAPCRASPSGSVDRQPQLEARRVFVVRRRERCRRRRRRTSACSWTWQFDGQWCMISAHSIADRRQQPAGSSRSVARAGERDRVADLPRERRRSGVSMVTTGARLPGEITTAATSERPPVIGDAQPRALTGPAVGVGALTACAAVASSNAPSPSRSHA